MLTPRELRRALRYVAVWQQAGGMGQAEADDGGAYTGWSWTTGFRISW